LNLLEQLMSQGLAWLYRVTGDYALAIILLTVAIRVLLAPLYMYQMKSMKRMQELQPKIKELQEKYQSQPEKFQQEMVNLYREHRVNPFSGCLPLLIQMPFLWAIFQVLYNFQYVDLQGNPITPTLFGTSIVLNQPDVWYRLPLLSGLVTFVQSWLSMPSGAADPNARMMTYFMPVLIVWFTTKYPAGLALYWLVTTLVGLIQQAIYPGFPALQPKKEAAAK